MGGGGGDKYYIASNSSDCLPYFPDLPASLNCSTFVDLHRLASLTDGIPAFSELKFFVRKKQEEGDLAKFLYPSILLWFKGIMLYLISLTVVK